MNKQEHSIIMMNFSGVYREQTFYQKEAYQWIEGTEIPGTNGYCDEEAKQKIREKLEPFSAEGIHFLDGGNYHYLSSFWTEKIRQPYILAVLDWHTDMQASAFGDILSCGSWVRCVLQKQPLLKKVLLLGVNEAYYKEIETDFPNRVCYFSTEQLKNNPETVLQKELEKERLAVYLSIDKDVLAKEVLQTDWDQGTMHKELLRQIVLYFTEKTELIGVDICGECTGQGMEDTTSVAQNDRMNAQILDWCRGAETQKGGKRMRMIHLEDSIEKYIAIKRVLADCGVDEIVHVSNVQDGIEKIEQAKELGQPFDFAITDMQYPLRPGESVHYAGGEMFLQQLAQKRIELPVIVCSSLNLKLPEVYACVWYSPMSNWERKMADLVKRLKSEKK
ncbi:MAG: arginase family protein [Lachnospiraceae bacterium]